LLPLNDAQNPRLENFVHMGAAHTVQTDDMAQPRSSRDGVQNKYSWKAIVIVQNHRVVSFRCCDLITSQCKLVDCYRCQTS